MRRLLTNLTPASSAAADMMNRLGMITASGSNIFYDSSGKLKSLTDVQQILHDKLSKLTPQMQTYAEKVLFGQYALNQVAIVAGESPAAFQKLTASMGQAGATMQALKDREQGWSYTFMRLTAEFQTIQKEIGLMLKPVVDKLTTALQNLMNWWDHLSEGTKKFISISVAVMGVLALIGGAVMTTVAAFGFLTMGLAAAGEAFAAIGTAIFPITLIVAGVVVAVKAFHDAWVKDVGHVREFTAGIFSQLRADFRMISDAFRDLVGGTGKNSKEWENIWHAVEVVVVAVFKGVTQVIEVSFHTLAVVVRAGLGVLKGLWEYFADGVWKVIKGLWEILNGHWSQGFKDLQSGAVGGTKGIVQILKSFLTMIDDLFYGIPSKMLHWGEDMIDGLIHGIENKISSVENAIGSVVKTIQNAWSSVTSLFSAKPALPQVPSMPSAVPGTKTPLTLPHYATGGIALKPQIASLAENGPELVIPLKGLNQTGSKESLNAYGIGRAGIGGSKVVNIHQGAIVINMKNGDGMDIGKAIRTQISRAIM